MKVIEYLKSLVNAVKDPERDFSERLFLILTLISELTVFIAFIGDLVTKEDIYEIAVLIATLIIVPTIVLICLHFEKLKLAIRMIVIGLLFLIIPALFFFGGGLEGGGYIWIIFAFLYVGMVLKGRWRNILFLLLTLITMTCYTVAYFYPDLVYPHSWSMFYIDSFISLVLVGMLCFVMMWVQGRLFEEENKRARKEAERAEKLTRSQNRFFSSMSHEIRTPINSILGLNELILRDQNASDDILKDASGIQGSGKMLLALINDILDFSKIEAGSMDIVPVDYRIGDMLSEIVNMMWLRAHDKGLGFEVSVDPDVPMVLYGDEVRIKQIVINLLNNAVKYTTKGHVELRVECNEADDYNVELLISITDTGMGIKKEDIPYLFDAFKRVDEGKNRHIEGTGLGLSIVKQLVELMDGTINVNSVYGEGSTFAVSIKQGVSDRSRVGELNIHNQQVVRNAYECSFVAPEAKILIVDDNEMNLEVECRLLEDTDMRIDKALSGKEALEKCLTTHYDTIFMDHLMPGMDGIECLEALRDQAGGLNRNTPVIILTANAGSENRELYIKAGFDGYLVKPVSGVAMEDVLVRHIPEEKIIRKNAMMGENEEINTADRYSERAHVIITSSSMCDLPDSVIKKLHIPIIPCRIRTENGVFKDGIHMDANELVKHMSLGKEAESSPPNEADYMNFFADALKKAHHVIHISISTSMSKEYYIADEASKVFDNVTVVNSECISSASGILVLIAYKLAQQGAPFEDIVSELETVKKRLRCSFIVDTTEFMSRKGLVSKRLNRVAEAINLHPAIRIRNDRAGVGGLWFGRTKRAYRRYISKALPADTIPDSDVVFITYVDVPEDTLKWIEEEIKKEAYFEHVVFKQASAAVSSNCGPGTFGILYFLKSNKSYNIASYIDELNIVDEADKYDEDDDTREEGETEGTDFDALSNVTDVSDGSIDREKASDTEEKWYQGLEGLDIKTAMANSGSEAAFKKVLKIFHDSIPDKYSELNGSYESEDWENYTIKIHALKSSARLVGALKLGEDAQLLETAGKERDIEYIKEHHGPVMEDYLKYKAVLDPIYSPEDSQDEDGADNRPVADMFLMESIYEGLREAAEAMDCDMAEEILGQVKGYTIPEQEKERFKRVTEKVGAFDYDGILKVLKKD